jgi:tryptophan synthase beta chain
MESGRVLYQSRTDDEALAALGQLASTEGILCALETAHAIAALPSLAAQLGQDAVIVVCLSGRGDKDMITVAKRLGVTL